MRVMIVIGTRPQVIKTGILLEAFHNIGLETVLVHTGQHYDVELSNAFFQELHIREPDYNLRIGSGSYKYQIQAGVQAIMEVIECEKPNLILTIGDSNPVLVGGLGALFGVIKLAHYEAGVRSGSSTEPEERNRIFVDNISDYLFCPTEECLNNISRENISGKAFLTGDLRYDAWERYAYLVDQAEPKGMKDLEKEGFCLFTIHREGNAYNPVRLKLIVEALTAFWPLPLVWPLHPGVRKELIKLDLLDQLKRNENVLLLPPTTYLETRWLEKNCSLVVTDSVGLQVEAYLAQKPSIILRGETEFHSLESMGWSIRVDLNKKSLDRCPELARNFISHKPQQYDKRLFGDSQAAWKIASLLTLT